METRILHSYSLLLPDWSISKYINIQNDILDSSGFTELIETWNKDQVTISGMAEINTTNSLDLFGFTVVLGEPDEDRIQAPIKFTLPSFILYTIIGAVGMSNNLITLDELLGDAERLGIPDFQDLDFSTGANIFYPLRIEINDLDLRLILPEDLFQVGKKKEHLGKVVGIEPHPEDPSVQIPLGTASVHLDTDDGFSVDFDHPEAISFPPLLFRENELALQLEDVLVNLSEGGVQRDDDVLEKGIHIGKLRIWGLDKMFPFLPETVEEGDTEANVSFTNWKIGPAGFSGSATYEQPAPEALWKLHRLYVLFDNDWIPAELNADLAVDLGEISETFSDAGDAGEVDLNLKLRYDPDVAPASRFVFDLIVRSPEKEEGSLLVFKRDSEPATVNAALPVLSGFLFLTSETEAGIIVASLFSLQNLSYIEVQRIALNQLQFSYSTEEINGHSVNVLTAVVDLSLEIQLTDDQIKADSPLGLAMNRVSIRQVVNYRDAMEESGIEKTKVTWNMATGLDISMQTQVNLGKYVSISKVRLRRTSEHLLMEFGIQPSGDAESAILPIPDAVAFVFDHSGNFVKLLLGMDLPTVILIPGVLYLKGTLSQGENTGIELPQENGLQWNDALVGSLSGYIVGKGTAKTPEEHTDAANYMISLDAQLIQATRSDGLAALVVTLESMFSPGLALGTSGASFYGLGLTFAQNAAPNTTNGNYADWYMRTSPRFSTEARKWKISPGKWGFGASAIVGSTPDDGKSWNAKVGLFILLPGPVVMLIGKGNLFSQKPGLGGAAGAPLEAILVLDLEDNYLSVDLQANLKIPEDGDVTLASMQLPAGIYVDLDDPQKFSLYIGKYQPENKRILIESMMVDLSGYLMLDGDKIEDLPVADPLPGLALAMGGEAEVRWGFNSTSIDCYLYAAIAFHMGISLADPPLLNGQVQLAGGLVIKVFKIGFDLEVYALMVGRAPAPFQLAGEVGIRIGMPWPFSDIKTSARFSFGSGGELPKASSPFAGLMAHNRQRNKPVQIEPWNSRDQLPVLSIDPVFTLNFNAPVGNLDQNWESFNSNGADGRGKVWKVVTTGKESEDGVERLVKRGYRYEITSLKLTNITTDEVLSDLSALWEPDVAAGNSSDLTNGPVSPGGQVMRTKLQLMDYKEFHTDRYVGDGGKIMTRRVNDWQPCLNTKVPSLFVYRFHYMTTGILNGEVKRIDSELPPLLVKERLPAENAASLMRMMQLSHFKAAITEIDFGDVRVHPVIDRVQKVLSIPRVLFPETGGKPSAIPKETLQMGILAAEEISLEMPQHISSELYLLAAPNVLIQAEGLKEDSLEREELELQVEREDIFLQSLVSRDLPADQGWKIYQINVPEMVKRIVLKAAGPAESTYVPPVLQGLAACVLEVRLARDARFQKGDFTSDFFHTLIKREQTGNLEDLHLLEPGNTYSLEVEIKSYHVVQYDDDTVTIGDPSETFDEEFRFKCNSELPAEKLRASPINDKTIETWDIFTDPVHQEDNIYFGRNNILFEFRNAYRSMVYEKHKKQLVLRITDEKGEVQFDRARMVFQESSDLPPSVAQWKNKLAGAYCIGNEVNRLWKYGVADIPVSFEPELHYHAELFLLQQGVTDPDRMNFANVEPIHRWEFSTSRYKNEQEHLDAFNVYDEVTGNWIDQPGMYQSLGDTLDLDSIIRSDSSVDDILFSRLGLPPKSVPGEPEILRIWNWNHESGETKLIALLLDTHEPLLRSNQRISIKDHTGQIMSGHWITGTYGARLLFLPAGDLNSNVLFLKMPNSAAREVPIPVQPPILSS